MRRSAVLTLGGALLLGGASAVHADDLSGSDAPSAWTIAPAMYGVFSRVPENWSDLPVQLTFSDRAGYNSNILNTPLNSSGSTVGFGRPLGSLESISNFGGSTKAYWEGQQFFLDGSLGAYRYAADGALNSLTNSLDIGDNWTYGSKCSGKLILSERTSPSEPGQQVGFNVRNTATTTSFDETGECRATGNYALVLNSGANSSTNSAPVDKLNDFRSVFLAAGITYTVSDTNSLQLLATVTGTNYTDRASLAQTAGLASNILENQLDLTYTKNLSPNLALTATAGVVGVRNGSFRLEPASAFHPIYSLNAAWTATPKLKLAATVARTVAPPTTILANIQVTESANLNLTYGLTPKLLLGATVAASRSSGSLSGSVVNPVLGVFAQNSTSYNASASINYAMTPFVTANLSYTHTRTLQANLVTPTDVVLLALSYSPY